MSLKLPTPTNGNFGTTFSDMLYRLRPTLEILEELEKCPDYDPQHPLVQWVRKHGPTTNDTYYLQLHI